MVADDVYMYVRMCLRIYVCMRYARASPVSASVSVALPADVIGFGKRRKSKRMMMERKKQEEKSRKENNNNNIIN